MIFSPAVPRAFAALILTALSARALVVPVAEDASANAVGKFLGNAGTASTLTVNATRTAYIRFDLSDLNVVPSVITPGNLASATLQLYIVRARGAGAITVHAVTSVWGEKSATPNTAPSINSEVLAIIPASDLRSRHFVTVNLTPAIVTALGSGSDHGIALQTEDSSTQMTFSSKEGTANGWTPILDLEANLAQDGSGGINARSLTLSGPLTADSAVFSNQVTGETGSYAQLSAGTLAFSGTQASINLGTTPILHTEAGGNLFTGLNAGLSSLTGTGNTGVGSNGLQSLTSGSGNTVFGDSIMRFATTASYNTVVGSNALYFCTGSFFNTALGFYSMLSTTTGGNNTAVGSYALAGNTEGYRNVAFGESALRTSSTGANNVALGYSALRNSDDASAVTGSGNIAIGSNAGSLITGSNNLDLANIGKDGKSSVTRIGTQGMQNSTYISGIAGTTVASGLAVYVDSNGISAR